MNRKHNFKSIYDLESKSFINEKIIAQVKDGQSLRIICNDGYSNFPKRKIEFSLQIISGDFVIATIELFSGNPRQANEFIQNGFQK